jgi:hypothetical protein
LNAILVGLKVIKDGDDNHIWPPFAANIIFELWKDDESSEYFVKTFYIGKLLKLPVGNKNNDNGEEKCSLTDFNNLLKENSLTNEQYKKICSQKV